MTPYCFFYQGKGGMQEGTHKMSYLKQETSQSQEWLGKAMKTQTAADNHATETIAIQVFETF